MENVLRLVEIGDKPYIKYAFPSETSFFSTEFMPREPNPAAGMYSFSISSIGQLWSLLQAADLIVCHPTFLSPWHWRWLSRALFDRRALRGNIPIVRAFGPQMVALAQARFSGVNSKLLGCSGWNLRVDTTSPSIGVARN